MGKTNQKNKKYTYDPKILDALVTKYGMTKVYIRKCLRTENYGLTADKVKADYKQIQLKFNETINQFNNQN